jgi:hypothetical protein
VAETGFAGLKRLTIDALRDLQEAIGGFPVEESPEERHCWGESTDQSKGEEIVGGRTR